MIELRLASADGTADCVYRQWFLAVFLGPFSNFNDIIMPMNGAVLSEGMKTQASNKGFWPCPLCREISPVSPNLMMMLCTVDDEICKAILKYSTIFLRTLSQIGEPMPVFTSESLPL